MRNSYAAQGSLLHCAFAWTATDAMIRPLSQPEGVSRVGEACELE